MSSYFDIDAILLGQELLPCTLVSGVIKLGHMDPSGDKADLAAGTKLEFPQWLVKDWEEKAKGFLQVDTPKPFNVAHQQTLKADPRVVNLFSWCPFFYEFGLDYAQLAEDDDLSNTLQTVFSERYPMIMDMAQNAVKDDTSERTRMLDNLERRLFTTGLECDKEHIRWQRRQAHKIKAAPGLGTSVVLKRRKTSHPN